MAITKVGADKIAAKKIGVSYEEYLEKIASGMKWCTFCKTWKSRYQFDTDNSRGDGLTAGCIPCRRVKVRKQHKDSPPDSKTQSQASSAVSYEIKCGRMLKPSMLPCADCGKHATHYHHHLGYAKSHWLDVIPLCRSCHRKRHIE